MATKTMEAGQVGRSVPRLEGRAKVTGRAEYVHNMRLPGMLYGKIVRSTVAHGRIKSIDVSAARARGRRLSRRHQRRHSQDRSQSLFTARPFTTSRSSPSTKCITSASRSRWCLPADPHVAEAAAQLIVAEYEELPAVFDEVEAMTSAAIVHDELKPAGTFPDLKHLQGKKNTNIALDFHLRRGDVGGAPCRRPIMCIEHTFRTQQVLHVPLEPFVSIAEPGNERADDPHRFAIAVLRAHRDRATARLAGEQGAGESAVSRRRLRRQALHQARSAGGRARADRAAGR